MTLLEVTTDMYLQRPCQVTPRTAFVLSDYVDGSERGTVITEHTAELRNNRLLINGGRLIDAVSLATVLSSFAVEADGWIPPNLIYQSRTRIAWTVPGKRRRMAFTVQGQTHLLMVPWPHLLLIARAGDTLQVLALAHEGTPHRLNPVYHAPLMNLGGTGDLCFGNAHRPSFALASIPAFEDALFNTRFTHVNHPHTFAGRNQVTTALHLAQWQGLHEAQAKDLPRKWLRPLRNAKREHLTIEQVLSK